jgi:Protein of unknown function (DUF3551)
MRMIVTALLLATAAVTTNTAAARADSITYPWCAQFSDEGGARNCGFLTMAQCQAALSGNGGYCAENPMYRATTGAAPVPARRPQH